MARGFTRKQLKQDDFVEAAFNVEQWIEDHWREALAWIGAAVLVALLAAGWFWWGARQSRQARDLLAQGLEAYRGTAATATPGAGREEALSSFERAADKAGNSGLGRVATYYRGATLLRMGRAEEAIGILEPIAEAPEAELAATAKTMLAKAYASAGRTDDAVRTLRDLARSSAGHAEHALLELAIVLRDGGRQSEARETLQEIRDRYPGSPTAEEATRMLQRSEPSS